MSQAFLIKATVISSASLHLVALPEQSRQTGWSLSGLWPALFPAFTLLLCSHIKVSTSRALFTHIPVKVIAHSTQERHGIQKDELIVTRVMVQNVTLPLPELCFSFNCWVDSVVMHKVHAGCKEHTNERTSELAFYISPFHSVHFGKDCRTATNNDNGSKKKNNDKN